MNASPPLASAKVAMLALLVAFVGLLAAGGLAHRAWLSAPVPDALPAPTPRRGPPPPFLLAVIDGVREDAIFGANSPMPFVASLLPAGASGVAIAGDPTMSGPCIRTLLSGRAPDLYTAFRNIRAVPAEGNVVAALVARGARAAHAGDVVIPNLVGRVYLPGDVLDLTGHEFGDVGDLDDLAFPFALEKARDPGVAVLTYHLVTGDLTGHRYSAVGPEYAAALRVMDDRLRAVVLAFVANHPDATVLVAADHGLSAWGSHGSGEPEARRAPFVLSGTKAARVRGLEIPQAALAPTLAAMLGLPSPPLAEAPPDPALTMLSADEAAAAIDEHVRARIDVARRVGAQDVAQAIEARRAAVWLERAKVADPADRSASLELASLSRAIDDRTLAAGTSLAGALAVLVAFGVAVALSGGMLRRARPSAAAWSRATAALAAGLALLVLAGSGVALEDVFVAARSLSIPTVRALGLVALAGIVVALLSRGRRLLARVRDFAVAHPPLLVAFVAALLGFALTVRLGIDRVIHTPIAVATVALSALLAVALSRAAREHAPRARFLALGLAAAAFGGARVAEAFFTDDWPTLAFGRDARWGLVPAAVVLALVMRAVGSWRRGDRASARLDVAFATLSIAYVALSAGSIAEAASFAVLVAAARAAAEIPGPTTRLGGALLALLVLLLRVAAFHALGRIESLYHVNVGGHVLPGAAVGPSGPSFFSRFDAVSGAAALSLLAREGCVWVALILAVRRSYERAGVVGGLGRLAEDLACAYAVRGAAALVGLAVWWRWAWWVAAAYPVFVLATVDVALLALATALVGFVGRVFAPRGPRLDASVGSRAAASTPA